MEIIKTSIEEVVLIKPKVFEDTRGFFTETYRKDLFSGLGLYLDFVQDNHSGSVKNVLRGLHFQWEPAMGKLMRVTRGSAFLVAVDIRKNSPTLGSWYGKTITSENRLQVWAPYGFARGFCTLSDNVEIQYKCTGTYNGDCESGISWNDPEVGIQWPVENPILSEKDDNAQTLREWLDSEQSDNIIYKS